MFPDGTKQPLNLPEDVDNFYYDRGEQTLGWCTPGAIHFQEKDSKITTLEVPAITRCDGLVVSPRRHYAAVWYGQGLYLINLETAKFNKLSVDSWYADDIISVRFSFDEEILITSMPGFVAAWQVDPPLKLADSHEAAYWAGYNREILLSKDKSLAFTLNGGTGDESDQNQIIVWRVADVFTLQRINPPFFEFVQPEFTTFTLSPDDKLIATGDDFGGIRIWSIASGEELASFDLEAYPLDLAFTPDGSGLIILLGDGTARLWGVP